MQPVIFVQKYASGHPLMSKVSSRRENATCTSEKLQGFGWIFIMTTRTKLVSRAKPRNEAEQLLAAHKHPTPSQTTAPAFPPGLLPLPQPLPAPRHSQQTCSRKTPGLTELGEAWAEQLIPPKQGMLQRNRWSNETGDRAGAAELCHPVPSPSHPNSSSSVLGRTSLKPGIVLGWVRERNQGRGMISNKPMVGPWSQLPHGGHPAGWGRRSGKAREMLKLPGAAFPPTAVGIALRVAADPPSRQGVLWGHA